MKEAQRELQSHFWTTCPLSHRPLIRPIVSDSTGNLYNKDAVLQFLLPGDETDGVGSGISSKADCQEFLAGRVKGLRDVVELKFEVDTDGDAHPAPTAAAAAVAMDNSSAARQEHSEQWVCPITAKALGPNIRSVYLVPCGHVFCDEAIQQIKGDRCLQVSTLLCAIPKKEEVS